jgi:hypothetical protein
MRRDVEQVLPERMAVVHGRRTFNEPQRMDEHFLCLRQRKAEQV